MKRTLRNLARDLCARIGFVALLIYLYLDEQPRG